MAWDFDGILEVGEGRVIYICVCVSSVSVFTQRETAAYFGLKIKNLR